MDQYGNYVLRSIAQACDKLAKVDIRDDEIAFAIERELRRIDAHLWSLIDDLEEGII